ncbi:hypothetical protein P7C71_g6021, partial [Lecanoromycetidae sp. Uapishka_2]
MGLFILQETPVGYALLKAKSSKILKQDGFAAEDESAQGICSLLKLKDFHKFDSAATALEQAAALVEGKVTPRLSTLLDSIKDEKKVSLAVADPKLEWYGWHFPEMGRILNDNLAYSRVILSMGMRTNAAKADLTEILPEEIETAVKAAAEVSMGTEITTEDLDNIRALAEQVVSFTEYRAQLSGYLSARMAAIAPNLTALVGDLVGARLIAHAGSLMELAKKPASTIQILGAEKALFRALKTKHDTPKYGLIYHASLIGQATGKNKGKIARMLGTKAALGLRVDALADWSAEGEGKGDLVPDEEKSAMGVEGRLKIERRLASLEGKPIRSKGVAIAPNGTSFQPGKWEVKEARKYNPDADGLAGDEPAAAEPLSKKPKKEKANGVKLIEEVPEETAPKQSKKDKKEKANGVKLIEEVSEEKAPKPSKKDKKDRNNGIKPIEEIVEDAMEEDLESSEIEEPESSDEEMEEALAPTAVKDTKKNTANEDDDISETISTVSADTPDSPASPTQQEINWQSPIPGNTKIAKKARKKERHARRLALSEGRSAAKREKRAKLARRLDRKERRQKRAEQIERREERDDAKFSAAAKQAGLPINRYKRKLERGEIRFGPDGKAEAISKKDIKKARKAAEKAAAAATTNGDSGSSKKRKREEEVVEKSEKKKKKKHRAEE